ncbi:MAG: hypothetical protein EP338_02680 [Bacteroidetes bacterium]|nr:MAG: hypothetical protein EP338_02680 [Bacteroidota bacterium]
MIKPLFLIVLLFALHLEAVRIELIPGEFQHFLRLDAGMAILFVISGLIMSPGVQKGGEHFALRFLVMTTLQLLAMMTLILVLGFQIKQGRLNLALNASILFLIALGIQSYFLFRAAKKQH